MMFVTRITRVLTVVLIGAAGTALVGLQAKCAAGALAREYVDHRGAASSAFQTDTTQPTDAVQPGPNREPARDILIHADLTRTKAENDQISVDGPGTLLLWVDQNLLTSKTPGLAKGAPRDPTVLTISWTGKMQFIGRTTDAKRVPVARAEFRAV